MKKEPWVRLFLTAWLVYSVHFATNVVREHYPAFSLAGQGTLRVDAYQGLHPDIFVHTDGHSYINNNVSTSVVAALPLLAFNPLLDWLETCGRKQGGPEALASSAYRTDKPLRRAFFAQVRQRGLHLRFGGAAAVTSLFLMAPLSALSVVLLYGTLRGRGVQRGRALWLALLFAFGTPLFFRTAHLSHNLFVMYSAFGAFLLLWPRPEPSRSWGRVFGAGFLGGWAVAFDYSGVIPLLVLLGYLASCSASGSFWRRARGTLPFLAGSAFPLAFLLASQWVQFGHPLLPAQSWMAPASYTDQGYRGFSLPAPDLFLQNLFDPAFGLYAFTPLLALGLVPVSLYRGQELVLPRRERRMVAVFFLLFLLFCSANQYARMQWNSGFRYLMPLVPFVYLAVCDHLVRMRRAWLAALSVPVVLHSWVLSMVREPVGVSWGRFLREGFQLPWLTVLRQTSAEGHPVLSSGALPVVILGLCGLVVAGIWYPGRCAPGLYNSEQARPTKGSATCLGGVPCPASSST